MTIATFKAAVLQRWPELFVRGPNDDDFRCGPDALYFSGEGGDEASDGHRLFDYYAGTWDFKETFYIIGVHREIRDLATEHGCWFEWETPGSLHCYPG